MIRELRVPDDVDVIVTFDSAFDAGDPQGVPETPFSRGFSPRSQSGAGPHAPAGRGVAVGRKGGGLDAALSRQQFAMLELAMDNEDHVFARRRHADNLRVKKTKRRYAVASPSDGLQTGRLPDRGVVQRKPQGATAAGPVGRVVGLPSCSGFVSPRRQPPAVALASQGAGLHRSDGDRPPSGRVVRSPLAGGTVLPELKSRMQFECYVLMKFEAVERYLDLLLMGLLLLEQQRLRDMQRKGIKVGAVWVQARTTDRLRMLEVLTQRWNVQWIEHRLRTAGGRRRLLRELLRQAPCQVA